MNSDVAFTQIDRRITKLEDRDWDILLSHLQIKSIKKHQVFSEEGKMPKKLV